jgi:hypothetical protein
MNQNCGLAYRLLDREKQIARGPGAGMQTIPIEESELQESNSPELDPRFVWAGAGLIAFLAGFFGTCVVLQTLLGVR